MHEKYSAAPCSTGCWWDWREVSFCITERPSWSRRLPLAFCEYSHQRCSCSAFWVRCGDIFRHEAVWCQPVFHRFWSSWPMRLSVFRRHGFSCGRWQEMIRRDRHSWEPWARHWEPAPACSQPLSICSIACSGIRNPHRRSFAWTLLENPASTANFSKKPYW